MDGNWMWHGSMMSMEQFYTKLKFCRLLPMLFYQRCFFLLKIFTHQKLRNYVFPLSMFRLTPVLIVYQELRKKSLTSHHGPWSGLIIGIKHALTHGWAAVFKQEHLDPLTLPGTPLPNHWRTPNAQIRSNPFPGQRTIETTSGTNCEITEKHETGTQS